MHLCKNRTGNQASEGDRGHPTPRLLWKRPVHGLPFRGYRPVYGPDHIHHGNEANTENRGGRTIGPKGYLDILLIAPCTGNTLAKLANGITDTPVLMAAKAHLRNGRPLVISVSTNDALGINLKNIGLLFNMKNIYFVPFGQDNPEKKPNSMIARTELLIPSIEAALNGKQYQPVIQ